MTADAVAERLYAGCLDIQRGMSGLVMPTTPLGIATRVLYDILEADDLREEAIPSVALGQALACVVVWVRVLLQDDTWKSADLDAVGADLLRAVRLVLTTGQIES